MIFAAISQLSRCNLGKDWLDILPSLEDFLRVAPRLPDGRHELCLGAYANIESYTPKKAALFESHRRFTDIQMVLSGSEFLEFFPVDLLCAQLGECSEKPSSLPAAGAEKQDSAPDILNTPLTGDNCAAAMFPYDSGRDLLFYPDPPSPVSRLHLIPGYFAVFFPEDAHKPCLFDGLAESVRKCVIKIPVK